ncbi:MAG: phosphate acyltransferase [bacterium]|nr:phosphate acyltransferase [bacterium]
MNPFLHNLRIRATDGYIRKIILTETEDERVLEAAQILAGKTSSKKIAEPVFVGRAEDASKMKALGFSYIEMEEGRANTIEKLLLELRSSKIGTKDELTPEMAHSLAHDPLMYGMYLLREGEGDGLVAGAGRTSADVLRAGLWLVGKAPGIRTVSSSFYMIVPPFRGTDTPEVLTFSDCAVVPEPTSEQLADIAVAASDARSLIVGDEPRVALLSYSTKGSGGSGKSVATVRDALELIRKRKPELVVDGEIQADVALVKSISDRKAPGNLIDGGANVLIFPTLNAANIAYKLVAALLPGTVALGPILQGMNKPISDLSRGVRVEDIVNIVSIVASQAKKYE